MGVVEKATHKNIGRESDPLIDIERKKGINMESVSREDRCNGNCIAYPSSINHCGSGGHLRRKQQDQKQLQNYNNERVSPKDPSELNPSCTPPPYTEIVHALRMASATAATFLAKGRPSLAEQEKYECAMCWE